MTDIINQVQPKMFFTSRVELVSYFRDIFKKLKLDCPIFLYENTLEGCHDLKPFLENEVDVDGFEPPRPKDASTETFLLTLSSATTGKPKLINTTHMQILAST